MARLRFSLEKLGKLDLGKVNAAFDQQMQRVVHDCEDRPHDQTARKVILTANVRPIVESKGEELDIEFEVLSSVPKVRSKPYRMSVGQGGALAFNPDLPEDPESQTLFDAQERSADER